ESKVGPVARPVIGGTAHAGGGQATTASFRVAAPVAAGHTPAIATPASPAVPAIPAAQYQYPAAAPVAPTSVAPPSPPAGDSGDDSTAPKNSVQVPVAFVTGMGQASPPQAGPAPSASSRSLTSNALAAGGASPSLNAATPAGAGATPAAASPG